MTTPFKLRGWSGYQNSPMQDTDPHTGKNPDHGAHEKEKTEVDPDQKRADELKILLNKAMKEDDQATILKIRDELYQMYLKSKKKPK